MEAYLSLLQFVFLIILIVFLTFAILHFIVCFKKEEDIEINQTTKRTASVTLTEKETTYTVTYQTVRTPTPLPKGITCTWKPSVKTIAITHYYEGNQSPTIHTKDIYKSSDTATSTGILVKDKSLDGELVNDIVKGFLLALVKYKPPQDVTFGCTLTIVAEKWTLTAASCIESIEELDSLDSFVMMKGLGEGGQGRLHAVSDIMMHPLYQGVNKSYDLAAIKSEDDLVKVGNIFVTLPTLVDYLTVTIGDKMDLLGFGKFRNIDKNALVRNIRQVSVYKLPIKHCPNDTATWSPRHLVGGEAISRGSCGKVPLCAGVVENRNTPCNYCAGAPLLYRNVLLGVMSDNPHCGLACDPALYVNIAAGLVTCSVLMAVFVAGTLGVSVLQFVTAASAREEPQDVTNIY
ncbi:unnamed protein product, partial [Brenthis ino]